MTRQKQSLWQKILAICVASGSALTGGCIMGGSVTPYLGYNVPIGDQRAVSYEFGNAVVLGVKGSIKTKKSIEVEVGYSSHNVNFKDAFQSNELKASDFSIGGVYPFANTRNTTPYISGKVIARSEEEAVYDSGGNFLGSETRSSTGFGVGVGARFQAGKGSVDARMTYEGFGEGSYEESGLNASVGYTFSW